MLDQTRPTEMLRQGRSDDWQAATSHAFTRDLSDGTLPEDKMRWYLQQDYQFVDGFVRLLAVPSRTLRPLQTAYQPRSFSR